MSRNFEFSKQDVFARFQNRFNFNPFKLDDEFQKNVCQAAAWHDPTFFFKSYKTFFHAVWKTTFETNLIILLGFKRKYMDISNQSIDFDVHVLDTKIFFSKRIATHWKMRRNNLPFLLCELFYFSKIISYTWLGKKIALVSLSSECFGLRLEGAHIHHNEHWPEIWKFWSISAVNFSVWYF